MTRLMLLFLACVLVTACGRDQTDTSASDMHRAAVDTARMEAAEAQAAFATAERTGTRRDFETAKTEADQADGAIAVVEAVAAEHQ